MATIWMGSIGFLDDYLKIIKNISRGISIDSNFTIKKYCSIDEKYFIPIIDGMKNVVNGAEGTARNCKIPDYEICGKTGTAQNPHGENHSIFIAFSPKENPKIAIAVYVENGGAGSTWAAPIATLMIEKYLKKEITNKELAEDLENVLFDLTNGEIYEAMKDLDNIITYLKKEEKK